MYDKLITNTEAKFHDKNYQYNYYRNNKVICA